MESTVGGSGGDDDVIGFASSNTRFDSGKVDYCKRLPMMLQDCEIIRPTRKERCRTMMAAMMMATMDGEINTDDGDCDYFATRREATHCADQSVTTITKMT